MKAKSQKAAFLVGTRIFGVLGPCKNLIPRLVDMGFEVHVFGRLDEHFHDIYQHNCIIHSLYIKRSYTSFLFDFIDALKLATFIIRLRPSHLHSFNPKPQLIAFLAVLFFPGVNFYIGVTGLGNTFIKARYIRPLVEIFMKLSIRRAKYIFFQNTYDRDLFQKHLGLNKSKAKLFRSPGVDLERFVYSPLNMSNSHRTLRVLFVGRLIWQKGVDDFLKVYNAIKNSRLSENFHFTLVGGIDHEHPDRLSPQDLDFISKSSIEWIKWTSKIEDYYRSNHVLLFMSDREGGPRAILEASAIGRPTIGCNAPGVNQLIVDGETGYLVEKGDIETIVKLLIKYLDNFNLIQTQGLSARSKIAEPLSLENATTAQLQMYN